MDQAIVRRFEDKFIPEPNTGCFIWIGSVDVSGYGRFNLLRRNWKASRVAWLIANGDDPREMHVLHSCDNRLCVNPDHLFLGTNLDNCLDKAKKGRIPYAKLNPASVRRIRHLVNSGKSKRSVGRVFGVADTTIHGIMTGRLWSHVS